MIFLRFFSFVVLVLFSLLFVWSLFWSTTWRSHPIWSYRLLHRGLLHLDLILFIFFLLLFLFQLSSTRRSHHIWSHRSFIAVFVLDFLLFIFFLLLFCSPSRFLDALITTSRTVSSSRSSNKATTCFSLFFHFCQHTLIQ